MLATAWGAAFVAPVPVRLLDDLFELPAIIGTVIAAIADEIARFQRGGQLRGSAKGGRGRPQCQRQFLYIEDVILKTLDDGANDAADNGAQGEADHRAERSGDGADAATHRGPGRRRQR